MRKFLGFVRSDATSTSLYLLVFSIVVAAYFAFAHYKYAIHLFDWSKCARFECEFPQQLRVLVFIILDNLGLTQPSNNKGIANIFQLLDFLSAFITYVLLFRIVCLYDLKYSDKVLFTLLYWWALFATLVFSINHNYYYAYDALSMLFVASAIYMLVMNMSNWIFLMLLPVAVLNRETAILIPFFYIVWRFNMTKFALLYFVVLLLIYSIVKLSITHYFNAYNASVSFYHEENVPRIINNLSFVTFKTSTFYTWNYLLAFGGVWIFLIGKNSFVPRLRIVLLSFIPFLIGMLFVGNTFEIRIFTEYIPIIVLCVFIKLNHLDSSFLFKNKSEISHA